MEIERKFKVSVDKIPVNLSTLKKFQITQTYLNFSPEIRIRKINTDSFTFTVKSQADDTGLIREELEFNISEEEYSSLIKKQEVESIYKTRYLLNINNIEISLDVYSNQLAGLIIAEIEFQNIEEAQAFIPLEWFSEELTSDARYKNVSLAKEGLP